MTALATADTGFGTMLRTWRSNRRLSQLELASAAGVSSRHLSFIETGRARPSREMVVHLAEQLDVPLRHRNDLLTAAGFAPLYRETPLTAPSTGSSPATRIRPSPSIGGGTWSTPTTPPSHSSRASTRRCSVRRSTC